MEPSDRIANQKPYYFDSLNRKIVRLESEGMDIIRLDIGSPDMPPAPFIIEDLIDETRNKGQHGYSQYGGTVEFKEAAAAYYSNRFGVSLDPASEALGLIGSKEGVFHINQALLNPGDVALVPQPAYPTYRVAARFSGAEIYYLPLLVDNYFIPDLNQIPTDVARAAKVLWINYPNNPTGAVASLDSFDALVRFAKLNEIILLHDAPYMEIYYGADRPHSILEVPGAKDVALEFNSLSKSYNMAGWRVGMAVGNSDLVRYLHAVKMQVDTSNFLPIQSASVTALTGDQSWILARNEVYKRRALAIVQELRAMGIQADPPEAAIYVWFQLPQNVDDMEFCQRLLTATGVSVTPGSIYGTAGKGYVRISLCTPENRTREAMQRIAAWIKVEV